MIKRIKTMAIAASCLLLMTGGPTLANSAKAEKPSPDAIIAMMKEGNARYIAGKAENPKCDSSRMALAGKADQGDYAYATVISCSDSRVPVERIFDAGIMDLFIVRVAGNVVDTDEAGSIEYGLAHVNTPVLVVLGHTQCGAVKAVTGAVQGHGHALERNIPPLVENIKPAVERAIAAHPEAKDAEVVPYGIEENVYQSIEDLFMKSAATRDLVKSGKVKVVGALYDVSTGGVKWLPDAKTGEIMKKVEANPGRAMEAMAEGGEAKH